LVPAGVNTGSNVQSHSYVYDVLGNVTQRLDGATGRDERFSFADGSDGYDGLNRLRVQRVIGGATVTVAYDALGNITSKSDVGSYAYGQNAGPHAVTSAGGNSYSYDANGNMTSGAGRTLEWTSFNQLRKVTQGGLNSEFWFGAGHERVLQQESNNTKTVYVGALYEVVTNPDGLTELKHYIMTPLGRTAVRTVRMNGKVETRYFHQDALGSIAAVTDEWGRVEKRYTFDAWGKRVNTLDTHSSSGGKVTRGFTDHEMLDDFGLIHMNGRVYDPVLGRFLSADPFVGDVGDSQDYNRYSYLGNNPLGGTDPSGFFSLKDAVKIVAIVAVAWVTAGAALYAIGATSSLWGGMVMAATAGFGSGTAGLINAAVAGAGAGFGSGFAGSLLNGGSIGDAFKAGVIGGIVGGIGGALTFGIGNMSGDLGYWGTAGAHGVVQGGLNEAMGGDFRHGFYAGFAAAAAGAQIDKIPGTSGAAIAERVAASAVVGGTASVLGGGKFANGAVSGAFVRLFNEEAHAFSQRQLNRRWNMKDVNDILGHTQEGQVFADRLSGVEIHSYTEYDAIEIDPKNGFKPVDPPNVQRVSGRDGGLGFRFGKAIYINDLATNQEAIEIMFHETRHLWMGIPATSGGEAQIRISQISFMKDIGLRSMFANQKAAMNSITDTYRKVWTRGAVYGDKIIQTGTP